MDQPFESDVMADLVGNTRIASADGFDEYESLDEAFEQDGFDADAYDVAEGMAEFSDASGDEFEGDGFEDDLQTDLWDDQPASGDEFSPVVQNAPVQRRQRVAPSHRRSFDEYGDGFEEDLGDSFAGDEDVFEVMEAEIADALDAADSDEFLRRVVGGVRRAAQIAQRVGRTVGQVARTVAPIASMIPLPQAQAVARVANIAGRLLADGADEFAALDEMLAFAEAEDAIDAAAPIIAGLTIRTMMPSAQRLNRSTRRQLVQTVRRSTQTLVRRQGPQAARAVPRVVQAVQRTAQRRRIPGSQLPQAVQRATATVARNPRLVSQLARATQQASHMMPRQRPMSGATRTIAPGGLPQRLTIRGPVEITIRSR